MISGYNLENLILDEANLSKNFPLLNHYDHGWNLSDIIIKTFKDYPLKHHFTWNKRVAKIHSPLPNKKFVITGSPFIHYAQKKNIKKKFLKNTIFFLSHSMPFINQIINLEEIVSNLNNLPNNLKPVDICLHYHDLNSKKFFEKNNFKVFTPGKIFSEKYPENFFNILSNYSYSCSNTLGSYVLYSLYLNIPFFLTGPEPIYDNYGNDKNVPRIYKLSENKSAWEAIKLFKNFNATITDDQNKLMESELGLKDKIDAQDMKNIIENSFFSSFKSFDGIRGVSRYFKRFIYMKYKSLANF